MAAGRPSTIGRKEALYELLISIKEAKLQELAPSFSYGAGVVYPEALKVAVRYGMRDVELLDGLAELGALEKVPHESLVACPQCGSFRLFSKFRCPQCGSESLTKIVIAAHLACGGVNIVEEGVGGRTCSKCGQPLTEVSVIGRLYQCQSCGYRFETPLPAYRCADCGRAFDHREARYVLLHRYRVREGVLDSVAKKLLVELVREVGTAEGLKVEVGAQAKGRSGYYHPVDVSISDGRETVYIDIVVESPRAMSETLSSLAKAPDVLSRHYTLVPRSLEAALQGSGGGALTYSSARDVIEKVRQLIKGMKGGGGEKRKLEGSR